MTPYYSDDLVTIYHGDCREWSPGADAIVTDPPYGMGWDVDTTRFSGGSIESQKQRGKGTDRRLPVTGDTEAFEPVRWMSYPEVILWGFNHFPTDLPAGSALVWIKKNDRGFGSFLGDAEIAWKKGGRGVYCYRDLSMWGEERDRKHPTQKPLDLMRWTLGFVKGDVILDPFMGSGSTLVAAKSLDRKSIGIEIEERYCEIAANRCRQDTLSLFAS